MIKAIIFDVGEVLQLDPTGERYEKFAREFGIDSLEFRKFVAANREDLFLGRMGARDFCAAAKKKFSISASVEKIISLWKKTYLEMELNKKLFELIKKLKKNYKVIAVTNAHEASAESRKREPFLSSFDFMVVSCDVCFAKPQKEIFDIAAKKLGLRPEECLFIDDEEENVIAEKEFGFQTILYKSNSQLIKELKALGVKF